MLLLEFGGSRPSLPSCEASLVLTRSESLEDLPVAADKSINEDLVEGASGELYQECRITMISKRAHHR